MQEPLTSLRSKTWRKGCWPDVWRKRQDRGTVTFWDALLFSGPAPPSDMTATYHAGLPSWVKNSSSLFYLPFLGACIHKTQAENLSLHLACMKLGPLPTRNLRLFFTNLRIENPELWGRRAWVNPSPPWDSDAFPMLPAKTLSRQ